MLAAEREAVMREAYHMSLDIVEREMNAVLTYLGNVGTQAALLAQLAWVFFAEEYQPADMSEAEEVTLLCAATISFGAMLCVVLLSATVTSLAPPMALKGKDGATMRLVVEQMKIDQRRCGLVFRLGLVAFAVAFLIMACSQGKFEHSSTKITVTAVWCGVVAALAYALRLTAAAYAPARTAGWSVAAGMPMQGQGVVSGAEFVRKADAVRAATPRAAGAVAAAVRRGGRGLAGSRRGGASWAMDAEHEVCPAAMSTA